MNISEEKGIFIKNPANESDAPNSEYCNPRYDA